jgi:predicted dehydrogenase
MTWTEAVALRPPHDAVLYGTEATLVIGDPLRLYTAKRPDGETIRLDPLPDDRRSATEHFLHCVLTGAEPADQTSPALSRNAQEIIEAGLRSAAQGRQVHLPLEDHLFG